MSMVDEPIYLHSHRLPPLTMLTPMMTSTPLLTRPALVDTTDDDVAGFTIAEPDGATEVDESW